MTIFKVLVVADELEPVKLINYTQECLISHKADWLRRNLVEALHTAEKHDRFTTVWIQSLTNLTFSRLSIFRSSKINPCTAAEA